MHQSDNLFSKSRRLASSTLSSHNKTARLPPFKFQEARLFLLVLRSVVYRKISHSIHMIKITPKRSFRKLLVLQSYQKRILSSSLRTIQLFGQSTSLDKAKSQADTIGLITIGLGILRRAYRNQMVASINKIRNFGVEYHQHQKCLSQLNASLDSTIRRSVLPCCMRKFQSNQARIHKIGKISHNLDRILSQRRNQYLATAFESMQIRAIQEEILELQRKKQSTKQKSNARYSERVDSLNSQRQNLQDLKKAIDANALEKYQTMGEMKRTRALKIQQYRTLIRSIEAEVKTLTQESSSLKNVVETLTSIRESRQELNRAANSGKGGLRKVKDLYRQIIQPDMEIQSPLSHSSRYIILVKEKFKQHLSSSSNPDLQKLKDTNIGYQVYLNCSMRGLINLYQQVPTQSIQLSRQYINSRAENEALKESVGSLIFYQLLAPDGESDLALELSDLQNQFHALLDTLTSEDQFGAETQNGNKMKRSLLINKIDTGRTSSMSWNSRQVPQ